MASNDEWEESKPGQRGVEQHGVNVAKVRGTGVCRSESGVTVTVTVTGIDREQAIGYLMEEPTVEQQATETIKQIERGNEQHGDPSLAQQPARNER